MCTRPKIRVRRSSRSYLKSMEPAGEREASSCVLQLKFKVLAESEELSGIVRKDSRMLVAVLITQIERKARRVLSPRRSPANDEFTSFTDLESSLN